MKIKCFTSFTFSYLSRAMTLAKSLRQVHPDWEIWAVIVDKPPPDADLAYNLQVFDKVIFADDLGTRAIPWVAFQA